MFLNVGVDLLHAYFSKATTSMAVSDSIKKSMYNFQIETRVPPVIGWGYHERPLYLTTQHSAVPIASKIESHNEYTPASLVDRASRV